MDENDYLSARVKAVKDALRTLGEFFDASQFMGSYVDDLGHTNSVSIGVGNLYARTGLAQQFLNMDAAQTTAHELSMVLPYPHDDGECDCDECRGE